MIMIVVDKSPRCWNVGGGREQRRCGICSRRGRWIGRSRANGATESAAIVEDGWRRVNGGGVVAGRIVAVVFISAEKPTGIAEKQANRRREEARIRRGNISS